jgi:nucleoside-diphosphate-sugar epimerase
MSKFVVTGSRGYVARQLIRRLVAEGHEVVGLTRGGGEGCAQLGFSEEVVGDYSNEALLACAVNSAHAVFHLAARAHQRNTGKKDEALFYAANVLPTQSLARACAVAGVARIVMLSSIGVLGNRTDVAPFSDATIPAPVDPYAISKAHAEQRLAEVLSNSSCDYCVLRPPLVYGPGSPGNFSALVTIAAKAPLIPLGGIHAPRTFIHVDHLVDALVVAATHPEASRRTFVVADREDTSVAEIINTAARHFRRESWRVVAIPEMFLRALSSLAGQHARMDKLLAALRVDGSGFQIATGWRPSQSTSDAIGKTLRNWKTALL